MKLRYKSFRFGDPVLLMIEKANEIIAEYDEQGYELTLRQLYYQFVARDLIPNKQTEYKKLGSIINDGRLAGMISWASIVDRTRNLMGNQHWDSPSQRVRAAAGGYRIDKWAAQVYRVEVWIEKDALVGVIANVCSRNDVDYFSCRGYTSQSEMWAAGRRLKGYIAEGQKPVIIHLGDHDPSGIDMTRDIKERLTLFANASITVERIALNMNQVRKYKPPPNPAKLSDTRSKPYIKQFGSSSWELDALEPKAIEQLVEETILGYRAQAAWDSEIKNEERGKAEILKAAKGMKR